MERYISVVVPNYNMEATIGKCLEAAFASDYENFEVIVVDDHSSDNSLEIIREFPCVLVCLDSRSGTSAARNRGAEAARGDVIFFTDADCLLKKDTLSVINRTLSGLGPQTVVGGTYSPISFDRTFFSTFQSVFVNYSETKNANCPDYIAAHAMIIDVGTFRKSSGFPEKFMPILEDVEFSHRLRRAGCSLIMNPAIQVRHIFNFSLWKSLRNAFRKTMYWSMYSLQNKDVFTDSGSASTELKTNVFSFFLNALFAALFLLTGKTGFLYILPVVYFVNIMINRRFLKLFHETEGISFAVPALLYYTLLYPVPIGAGSLKGIVNHFFNNRE